MALLSLGRFSSPISMRSSVCKMNIITSVSWALRCHMYAGVSAEEWVGGPWPSSEFRICQEHQRVINLQNSLSEMHMVTVALAERNCKSKANPLGLPGPPCKALKVHLATPIFSVAREDMAVLVVSVHCGSLPECCIEDVNKGVWVFN